MRITKAAVIQAASDIADQNGLNQVSLKTVAEKLKIRTPSLYNHIESFDDLLREVAHNGMKAMNEKMAQSAIGKSGNEAIKAAGAEYFHFMIEHPGVYETIQWVTWHGNKETAEIFSRYQDLLSTLILSCCLKTANIHEILNLLMGLFHGYTTLQLNAALSNPEEAKKGFCQAIDTTLLGIQQKYG